MLTYHLSHKKVYESLTDGSDVLLVDQKHREMFQSKVALSFRRAKNLKDQLVAVRQPDLDDRSLLV